MNAPDGWPRGDWLRKGNGDNRPLIETPGHAFKSDERELLVGMMGLFAAYGWTAYAHFDHGLTVLIGEGKLMDIWDTDEAPFRENTKGLA
jgi:hypothetical protein